MSFEQKVDTGAPMYTVAWSFDGIKYFDPFEIVSHVHQEAVIFSLALIYTVITAMMNR